MDRLFGTQDKDGILVDAAILSSPWNLSIAIDPYQIGCDLGFALNIKTSSRSIK
jgi:hypothetical protein